MRYEIDIFHYLDIYKKHWKRMAFLIAVAACITAMAVFVKPVTYRSTLTALSSAKATQTGNIGKLLGISSLSSDDIIFSILKSRRMRDDINKHFKQKLRPKDWWNIDTYLVTGGFAVEVTGSDPDLTKEIVNYAVETILFNINKDLKVATTHEDGKLVKVLDLALRGTPIRRNMSKKVIVSSLFVLLIYTLFIFFREYFSQMKTSKNK